jgi:hypothetical protein
MRLSRSPQSGAFHIPIGIPIAEELGGGFQQVPFVLDSGADVSIVPRETAFNFGLIGDGLALNGATYVKGGATTYVESVGHGQIEAICCEVELELPGGSRTPIEVAIPKSYFGTECLLSCRGLVQSYRVGIELDFICFHPLRDGAIGTRRASPRLRTSAPTLVNMRSPREARTGVKLSEISLNAIVIECSEPFSHGDEWECELNFDQRPLQLRATLLRRITNGNRWVMQVVKPSKDYVMEVEGQFAAARNGSSQVTVVG